MIHIVRVPGERRFESVAGQRVVVAEAPPYRIVIDELPTGEATWSAEAPDGTVEEGEASSYHRAFTLAHRWIQRREQRGIVHRLVDRGHGVISLGRGMILVYGPTCPETRGVVFVANDLPREDAVRVLYEALDVPISFVRTARQPMDHAAPTEE